MAVEPERAHDAITEKTGGDECARLELSFNQFEAIRDRRLATEALVTLQHTVRHWNAMKG